MQTWLAIWSAAVAGFGVPAEAATKTWTAAQSDVWGDGGNWNPELPGSADTALFDSPSSSVEIDSNFTVGTLELTANVSGVSVAVEGLGAALAFAGTGVVNGSSTQVNWRVGLAAGAGEIAFNNSATAANSHFDVYGGFLPGDPGGVLRFTDSSLAGASVISVRGGSGGGDAGTLVISGLATAEGASVSLIGGSVDISGTTVGTSIGALTGNGSVALGSKTLTVGDLAVAGAFAGTISGSGNLVKEGGALLRLTDVNTFTGSTTVAEGTLGLEASGALQSTSSVQISGGTLLLEASGATTLVNDSAAVVLAGGKLATASKLQESFGTLSMTSSSLIDMGVNNAEFTFAAINATGWSGTLSIWNWTGGGLDRLYFTTPGGLSSGQLSAVRFYSDSGATAVGSGASFTGSELTPNLTPVPEAGALAWLASVLGVAGWRDRRGAQRRLTRK